MSYSELLFRRKDAGLIYADQARMLVASACDGIDIDPAIFNRNANGKQLSDTFNNGDCDEGIGIPPRIVFDGGPGFVRIYGLGKAGSKTLESEAPKIFSALYKRGFIGFDQKSGAMGIERRDNSELYRIRYLVVARKPLACSQFVKAPLAGEIADAVSSIILRGMTGIARLLDDELADQNQAPRFETVVPHQVDLVEGEPTPVTLKPGLLVAAYKNVVLSMPCKLTGPWSTGLLRSRGYGQIRLVNQPRGG